MLTAFWVEPYVLYKHHLKVSSLRYFVKYIFYSIVVGGSWFVTDLFCKHTAGSLWMVLMERLLVCLVVPNLLFLLFYVKTGEFGFLWMKLLDLIKKRRGK
jgi:hypothetical protein